MYIYSGRTYRKCNNVSHNQQLAFKNLVLKLLFTPLVKEG